MAITIQVYYCAFQSLNIDVGPLYTLLKTFLKKQDKASVRLHFKGSEEEGQVLSYKPFPGRDP